MKMGDLPSSVVHRLSDHIKPPPPRRDWGADPDDPTLTGKQGRVLSILRGAGAMPAALIAARMGERPSKIHRVLRALHKRGRIRVTARGPVMWRLAEGEAPHYLPPALRSA